jgi:hypothetical protein
LKKYFKNNPLLIDYADFYGLRDFYHMIKQFSRSIRDGYIANREDLLYFVKLAIERNFGGKLKAAELMGHFFASRQ